MKHVGRAGFTLVEILVVLILMGIAAGLVAPAFRTPRADSADALDEPLRIARRLALSRGETVYLDLASSGEWAVHGASSLVEGPLASGRVDTYDGPSATMVASPLGTCAYDISTVATGRTEPLDALSCTVDRR